MDAQEYLKSRIKVWCHNRNQWETDDLTIIPDGDFIDTKGRVHRAKNHTAYVTLEDALTAIEMVQEALLADSEARIDALKSENKLLKSLKALSEHQEKLAQSYTPGEPDEVLQSLLNRITAGSTVTSEELKVLLNRMGKQAQQ